MPETKAQVQRFVNCRNCWAEGTCLVEFTYTEAGRISSAQVVNLPQGWRYRPYGEQGGQAPYCPACQDG